PSAVRAAAPSPAVGSAAAPVGALAAATAAVRVTAGIRRGLLAGRRIVGGTLTRSGALSGAGSARAPGAAGRGVLAQRVVVRLLARTGRRCAAHGPSRPRRSEEHASELQSREN